MHAVALTAQLVPLVIELLLPQIEQILQKDKSTIVRDYAVDTLGNYASGRTEQAHQAFPILKNTLNLWDGKHAKQVLLGFINISGATQAYNEEICRISEKYLDHKKGVVRKAAKAALKAVGCN
jgi:hypothetical protein